MAKYKNEKITIDGYRFDSKIEAKYYEKLKIDRTEEKIKNFELQPIFILQNRFIKYGKTHRSIILRADFIIYHVDGSTEVIDIKGMATPEAKMKRKMFDCKYADMVLTWLVWYGGKWVDYDENIKARAKRKREKLL